MLKAHSKAWQVNAKYDPALDPGQKRERERQPEREGGGGREGQGGKGRRMEEAGKEKRRE